jgi:hypothetical protein
MHIARGCEKARMSLEIAIVGERHPESIKLACAAPAASACKTEPSSAKRESFGIAKSSNEGR